MKPIRAAAVGTAAVVAAGALVAVLVSQQSDDDTVARDDVAATPSASPSPTPSTLEPLDFGAEPELRSAYKKAAQRAVADGLVTMIPAALPEGWTTRGGGYRDAPEPAWWRMEFETPSGPVVLDQLAGTPDEVLAGHRASLTEQPDVDLGDDATGPWSHHSSGDSTVLSYRLKGSTVVVQATDVETASALAGTLLPAEGQTRSQE